MLSTNLKTFISRPFFSSYRTLKEIQKLEENQYTTQKAIQKLPLHLNTVNRAIINLDFIRNRPSFTFFSQINFFTIS